ncbi:MAG: YkvA family protein, partial [Thermodesulfobacteriota bacterium]
PLGEVWEYLMLLFRMLRAYLGGRYRDVSWQSLVAIVGALVYFVMPIDLIPDAVAGLGFADDAAVIAWTIQALREEIDRFSAWETEGEETVEDP